jgi:hypothetical protein
VGVFGVTQASGDGKFHGDLDPKTRDNHSSSVGM